MDHLSHLLLEGIEHAIKDGIRLLPFLFITYLVMEYVEHSMEERTKDVIRKSGKWGPLLGALCGAFPQCGFSAAAANLYAGRIITLGTLIAIFLSTSDEMLPILISEQAPVSAILQIIGIKVLIGLIAGFILDFFWGRNIKMRANPDKPLANEKMKIAQMCETEKCKCTDGIFKSALKHTLHIFVFIFAVTVLLNMAIHMIGEENLGNFILNRPVIGVMLAAIIGLLPNCAASVVITTLYLEGMMSFGAMMSGLLVGAGVGILVLCRVNKDWKDNLKAIGLLYLCGVAGGLLLEVFGMAINL